MFKMFSWLEGTQVLKTAEQWLSALQREDGFSIDFTNGKSLLHKGEDPSLQYQYRIEGINLQERRLNLECFCLVFRGSNPVEVSSPGFHATLEALLRI